VFVRSLAWQTWCVCSFVLSEDGRLSHTSTSSPREMRADLQEQSHLECFCWGVTRRFKSLEPVLANQHRFRTENGANNGAIHTDHAKAGAVSSQNPAKNAPFSQLFLCLSRACLGKRSFLYNKWAGKKGVFRTVGPHELRRVVSA
jgi:hypothetical protein